MVYGSTNSQITQVFIVTITGAHFTIMMQAQNLLALFCVCNASIPKHNIKTCLHFDTELSY